MIVNENFLKKLRSAFDLNIYEVKIWTALLSKGVASAGELSDISNVPRSRSYDVLESLEKKGFIIMKIGKPIKYIAVEPKDVILRVKKEIDSKAKEKIQSLDKITSTDLYDELSVLYKNGINHVDHNEISSAIKGRKNIYGQMESMLNKAKKSVIISTSALGLKRKNNEFRIILQKLAKKGVNIKFLAPINESNKEAAKELRKFARIKNTKNNSRFVLVDNSQLMFMLNNDEDVHETYDIGVWVNSPYFSQSLGSLVNSSW